MSKYFWLSLIMLVCSGQFSAQKDTTIIKTKPQKSFFKATVLPTTLILSGVLLTGSQAEKNWQKDVRNKVGNDYRVRLDDYIQYVPYLQVYIGDIVGLKAKNHWFDQTKNIFIGGLVTTIVTHSLKRGVGKERPDGSANTSFSSGHAANAFLGATILYQEYKGTSQVYAYSGYAFAVGTGSLRVMNNRHWVSDVLAGAGIGILVANLVYYIEPLKNWNPFKKTKNLTFSPMINDNGLTFTASFQF
jgi:PAP2 superfamily